MTKNLVLLCLFVLSCHRSFEPLPPGSNLILRLESKRTKDSTLAICSIPREYNPEKRYPLLVMLHGHGDVATAIHDLWKPVTDSLGFILLSLQGEKRVEGAGWSWGSASEEFVKLAVDEVKQKINVDGNRIYIGGFSSGGRLASIMGLKYGHVFSGLVALGAPVDKGLLNSIRNFENVKHLKIYVGHGTKENNFEEIEFVWKELNKTGLNVHIQPWPDIGHQIPEPKKLELIKIVSFFL